MYYELYINEEKYETDTNLALLMGTAMTKAQVPFYEMPKRIEIVARDNRKTFFLWINPFSV